MSRRLRTSGGLPLFLLIFTLANLIIFLTDLIVAQTLAIFVLTVLLPGFLAFALLPQRNDDANDGVQRLVMGFGLGYIITIAGSLLLHYLPGPMTRELVVLFYDALTLGLFFVYYVANKQQRAFSLHMPSRGECLCLAILILVTFFFRFFNLSYAEFQGDEVAVLHKAAACIQGRQDALFLHKKGPAEILLSACYYAIARHTNEWAARFPFALANLIGVLALYTVGQDGQSQSNWPSSGWWAALLVALNGFFVAFGRIVQYQSLVFLFSTLGILAALRFAQNGKHLDLYLTALFLAMGLLAHSDAVFGLITSGFIVLKALYRRHRGGSPFSILTSLLGPALLAGVLLASFYVPFALHPRFEATQGYLKWRMGTRPPYNNLDLLLDLGTVYNAVYYLALLALALVLMLAKYAMQRKREGWVLLGALTALTITRFLLPGAWNVKGRDLTGLLFALPLAFPFFTDSIESRETTPRLGWQAALVWFGAPFLIYMFVFREPRTHIYTIFPGAALLVAQELGGVEKSHRRTWFIWGATGIILLISAAYLYVAFVDHTPEYKRTYAKNRIRFFWTPFGTDMPEHGLFGFPYRAGWKVIGQLYAFGALEGDYGTNEETHITRWYTRGEYACRVQPHYYFVAENVQDEQPVPRDVIESAYTHFGTVWVGDKPKLRLYERGTASLPHRDYHVSEAAPYFDRELTKPEYPTGLPSQDPTSHIQHRMYRKLGQHVEFLGYDLSKNRIHAGDIFVLTLYWRALGKMAESYTVFTHVEDSGVVWAQKDHPPLCGTQPTSEWEPGRVYVDPYVIVTDAEIPPGPHPIIAGMYRFGTGERLPVSNAEGVRLGGAMELATITILER